MKNLYNKVIEAYKSGDENAFAAAARNWVAEETVNPFEENTEEYELFFKARTAYDIWYSGAINARVSKRRMIAAVKSIAELNLPNPYGEVKEKKKLFEKVAEQKEQKEQIHVLGVVPEKKEETVEISEEVKPEKKHIFGKRKKDDSNDSERLD